MKHVFLALVATTTTASALWLAYGGIVVTIILVTVAVTTLLISAFGLGSWWSTRLIQQGATIALQAQTSDDQRDIVQIKALASLVKETLKFQHRLSDQHSYPLLDLDKQGIGSNDTIEADFTIAGLDEMM